MAINTTGKLPLWRQLRSNLIAIFVLLAVLPVTLLGYFTIRQIRTQTTTQVVNQLQSVSVLKQAQLEDWLDSVSTAVTILLSNPTTYDQLTGLLTTPQPTDQQVQVVSAVLAKPVQPDNQKQEPFKEIFLYDTNGHVLAGSDPVLVGRIVNHQPYFKASLAGSNIQSPYYEVGTGELSIIVSSPVTDAQGHVLGVLAVRPDLTTLGTVMLERSGLGETGETYLVSQENNYPLTPLRAPGYTPNRAYHSDGIDQALTGENGSGAYVGYEGAAVIGVYRWIPELKAALVAEIDQTEALTLFSETQQLIVELGVIAALLAVVVGLLSAARISAPIIALTDIATRVAQGDMTPRAQLNNHSEIGVLAKAFNTMTDQLVRNIDQLDQKVHETEEANQALRIASAQAREAARLKSEFVSTMSHELRTPLNAILGFSGIMLQGMGGDMDSDAEHMVKRIDSNSQRLLGLINDILDLAKIEAGRMEMTSQPFSPRDLAERWRSQTSILAEKKALQFKIKIDPALPDILYGDTERLTQITVNLLSNAFKFTEKGNVTLSLECQDANWLIKVSDTGIGIPPHALNYIFDEFRQVDGTSTRAYGGSGLGLSICRNMCRMMQGTIRVTSELGKGSVFTVTLPLITAIENNAPVDASIMLETAN